MQKRACLPEHWGRAKSSWFSVQVARGKGKSQEGRERRAGIEVHVSTGYWLPGGVGRLERSFRNNKLKCPKSDQIWPFVI